MKIALLEPFFTGSHQAWAEGYQQSSQHDVDIFSLPGRHWKWRMHGGAVSLAKQYSESTFDADLILATDMLDLSVFLALTKNKTSGIPVSIYFHENQLTYPWSTTDPDVKLKRDGHYTFINYTSALSADRIYFNSQYHLDSFLNSLPVFLNQFPDFQEIENVETIKNKSQVLHLGMDLKKMDVHPEQNRKEQENNTKDVATILWNHRWEYDKRPELFFESLFRLKKEAVPFKLIVLGESFHKVPPVFAKAKELLNEEIIHFGYIEDPKEYTHLLWQADLLPVTGIQDFFGGSVVEALYCGCSVLLPNRLAYPEHIPIHLHDKYFYDTDKEFYDILKSKVLDIEKLRGADDLQAYVAKYDWETQALLYDRTFEALSSAK